MSNNTETVTEDTSQVPLEYVPLDNLTTTVNVLYNYLDRANKRGAFGLQESAKVMQCMALIGSLAKAADAQNATSNPLEREPNKNEQQGVRKKS